MLCSPCFRMKTLLPFCWRWNSTFVRTHRDFTLDLLRNPSCDVGWAAPRKQLNLTHAQKNALNPNRVFTTRLYSTLKLCCNIKQQADGSSWREENQPVQHSLRRVTCWEKKQNREARRSAPNSHGSQTGRGKKKNLATLWVTFSTIKCLCSKVCSPETERFQSGGAWIRRRRSHMF